MTPKTTCTTAVNTLTLYRRLWRLSLFIRALEKSLPSHYNPSNPPAIPYAWKCSREEIFANFANDVTFANIYFANISHLRTSYTRVLLYFGAVSYNVSCFRRRHGKHVAERIPLLWPWCIFSISFWAARTAAAGTSFEELLPSPQTGLKNCSIVFDLLQISVSPSVAVQVS